MTDYAIWKPEHDGHAPPNWREGMMVAACSLPWDFASKGYRPDWLAGYEYKVEPEALNSPNDDGRSEAEKVADEKLLKTTLKLLRQYPAEELAKHGITLAPEKDWATELWADLLDAWGVPETARRIRVSGESDDDEAATELLRTRFEQMIAERSKRDA